MAQLDNCLYVILTILFLVSFFLKKFLIENMKLLFFFSFLFMDASFQLFMLVGLSFEIKKSQILTFFYLKIT